MVVEISCEEVWREISNYLEGESALLSIGLEGGERPPQMGKSILNHRGT